jgi:4-diphosphocytidyl-2-C-methyl-D-erythritol kinase
MIYFPNAKINLGLKITGKRPDGYHNLKTLFFPVPLCDILEVMDFEEVPLQIPSNGVLNRLSRFELTDKTTVDLVQSGIDVPGPADDNLCLKAVKVFSEAFQLPAYLYIHLHKIIPTGTGLGGGSSDAVSVLKWLFENFGPGEDPILMHQMALKLGSDCPFFIFNRPSFATGRGDKLSPVEVSLKGYYLALLIPPVHVSTAAAFAGLQISDQTGTPDLTKVIRLPVEQWRDKLENDFETTVFSKYPLTGEIKKMMYDQGALYASMSGSGSAVYGIFDFMPELIVSNTNVKIFSWKL